MSTTRVLSLLAVSLLPTFAADQVVLKNGDTITGSIIKKDGDKLTMKSEFLGEVSMPWSAVKSLKSDETLTVAAKDAEPVAGKVTTSGDTLQVATAGGTKTYPLADVHSVRNPAEQHSWERLQHPGLLELWTGFYDLGYALARGNARTETLTNAFNATRVTRNDRITISVNQIYGTARINGVSDAVANAIRGVWTYNHGIGSKLFLTTLNSYEHDPFQNLHLRFVVGGGLGWNTIKTDKYILSFTGGGDYARENFFNHIQRNSGEIFFGDDFIYKVSAATNITQSARIFPNVTDTGQYRFNFDLAAVTAIKKWLAFHITASNRFLSNPVPGVQKNDVLLSTGFRVTFSR